MTVLFRSLLAVMFVGLAPSILPARETPSPHVISLHAGAIDTSRADTQTRRQAVDTFKGKRLHLIQWSGPVQPEWYEELITAGLRVVDYIPENAYLVYGDAESLAGLQRKLTGKSHVRWEGPYRARDKIHPQAVVSPSAKTAVSRPDPDLFSVQLVLDPAANAETLELIEALKLAPIVRQRASGHYYNLVVRLPPDAIAGLAEQPDIISIWPYRTPEKRDERQGMIVAGQLAGNGPSGAGYLAWLAGKGFTQAQFDASGLVVDVTDSGLDNGTTNVNHFALYRGGTTSGISRVRYVRREGTENSGSTIQGCDGHGNINAHIVGGHVTLTGFPHTDSAGYRYGLGIAPFVKVGSSVIFDPSFFTNPDYDDLASRAYRDGARISGNSWGADTFGGYDADAQNYDRLVRDSQPAGSDVPADGNQEFTFVFAAGNAGSSAGTVGSPGTAKNVITVGAAENVHSHATTNRGNNAAGNDGCDTPDSEANSANDIATFSSRGPCSDGRRKPEIVAPGTHITGGVGQSVKTMAGNGSALSCFDAEGVCALPGGGTTGNTNNFFPLGQRWYSTSSGTSHSTPAVAGGAALIYQWFLNQGLNAPSPAMIKSMLMNSARYMNGTGANDSLYSNSQGMGMMNLGTAFDGTPRFMRDQLTNDLFTASGQSRTFTGIVVSNSKPLRVTLTWTDAPGSTSGNAYKNNLDLTVTVNGQTYRGNVFSGANSVAGGSADFRNNAESVFLPAGTAGAVVITITAANINSDGVPNFGGALDQDFALVAYNFQELQAPVIAPAGSTLISEGCGDGNGAPDPGELVTVALALQNIGTANSTNVVATLLATGGVSSPSGPQSYGALVAGGAAATNTFTFIANGICGGTLTATLSLQDGDASLGTATYNFTIGDVFNVTRGYTNATSISIPDSGNASPYPSAIAVSGLGGSVQKVTATLAGFSHTWPSDLRIALVSPSGRKVGLMNAAGGNTTVTGQTLTFDDEASGPIGASATTGVYQPSGAPPSMPSPAPPGAFAATLAEFVGDTPNGTWSLFVFDAFSGDSGSIAQGWRINITAGEPVCCVSNVPPVFATIGNKTVLVNASLAFPVTASDPVDGDLITLTASNLPPLAVFGSTNGVGTFSWAVATPAGVYTSRFYATDKDGTSIETVVITCRTNEPPVLDPVGNKFIQLSNTLSFAVTATDPVGHDAITLTASNLPAGATFGATNGLGTFTWNNAGPTGTYNVTFHAADVAGVSRETIAITVAELPPFVTYVETFDITANWGGGLPGSYNGKTYVNNSVAPVGDGFSVNSAVRETTFSITSNAWRLGNDSTDNLFFRYALTNIVTRFAVQLARWDNSPLPRFDIRYSLDGGSSYTVLFSTNGNWFAGDKQYQPYDSGPLNLIPEPGQQIWIELFRTTGERMLIDNFEVDYIPAGGSEPPPPPTGCVAFVAYTNSAPIDIVDDGPAAPYPSTITVSGLTQLIEKVTVTLHGLSHGFIADVDALLVGPGGQKMYLLAGAGFGGGASDVTLTFDDDALGYLPQNGSITSGTYWPTTYLISELNPPAPSAPYDDELSDLIGTSPNGTWSLFMYDWDSGDDGEVAGGWSINFEFDCPEPPPPPTNTNCGVIISEYVEGSSNNKALEIYNGTSEAIDLAAENYQILTYFNGSVSPGLTNNLVGILAAGGTFVLAHSSANPAVLAVANQTHGSGWFNGNDAVVLRKGGVAGEVVDSIGQVGFNPGTEWGSGLVSTADNTLRRKSTVLSGDTNPFDVFDPSIEWDGYAQDTFDGLGAHVMDCAPPNPDSDGDGILDQWELDNFGSLTNANQFTDWDLDGFIDLHEFLAGTDPKDPMSYLQAWDVQPAAGGAIVIQWPGVPGKTYEVRRATNLVGAIYSTIASNLAGVDPMNVVTDAPPVPDPAFYRIELVPAAP